MLEMVPPYSNHHSTSLKPQSFPSFQLPSRLRLRQPKFMSTAGLPAQGKGSLDELRCFFFKKWFSTAPDLPWYTMICSFEPWYIIWTISCTQGLDGWNMGHASNGTKQRSSSGSTFSRAPWVDQDGVQAVAAWEPMTKLLYLINLFVGPVGNPERT